MIRVSYQRLGELAVWVSQECQHAQANLLTLGPIHHDGTIIDCEDDDFLNPLGAESVLFLLVVGDLLCGSGGSECSLFRGYRLQDQKDGNNLA